MKIGKLSEMTNSSEKVNGQRIIAQFIIGLTFMVAIVKCNSIETSSYSKVAKMGMPSDSSNSSEDSPRLHRAREGVMNTMFLYPEK